MKLKDEFIKIPKEFVYETYQSIVYDLKDYDHITRGKMIDSILKEYSREDFLYYICTNRELEFLKYAKNKKLDQKALEKYQWEIRQLNKKCIFSDVTFTIYEEQVENVEKALKLYKTQDKTNLEEAVIFMIGVVKTHASMLTQALTSLIASMYGKKEEEVEPLFGHPLFHFYCGFYYQWMEFSKEEEEIVSYREYYDLLDSLEVARKEFGMAGEISFDMRDYIDIFYYGFPIQNKKVKKMYDAISKLPYKDVIFYQIESARVLNNRNHLDMFVNDEELELIEEALDEMPCAAMNGTTPKNYEKAVAKEIDLDKEFERVPQNNAHLCKNAADLYYKLYLALIDYTNQKYHICPEIKRIYKQEGLDGLKIQKIDKQLWKNKQTIDEFIEKNPYHFTKEELDIVAGFKTAVTSERFVIVGFEREYTKILSEDGKVYMVKGIRTDIDKLVDSKELPQIIETTLLMFKDTIVFNSLFSSFNIGFGNDFKEFVLKEYHNAMTYYHL